MRNYAEYARERFDVEDNDSTAREAAPVAIPVVAGISLARVRIVRTLLIEQIALDNGEMKVAW